MIPRWVEKFQLIPFVDKGRTMKGCDCLGLVALVLKEQAGISIPDYGFISHCDRKRIVEAIAKAKRAPFEWEALPLQDCQPFDVVTMRSADGVEAEHIGVMVSKTHVLHTELASGPTCEDVHSPLIANRIEKYAWRRIC